MVIEDGSISVDHDVVLNKWKKAFEQLLNPEDMQHNNAYEQFEGPQAIHADHKYNELLSLFSTCQSTFPHFVFSHSISWLLDFFCLTVCILCVLTLIFISHIK